MAHEHQQVERFTEIEKMFCQVDYAFEDIKNSIVTTDTFIENYLPFKLLQQTSKLFLDVLEPGT